MAIKYKIVMNYPARTTYDGVPIEEKIVEKEIPFDRHETVYYAYKKRKKWVLLKTRIDSVWATNIVGVRLYNNWCVTEDKFDRLFREDDLEKAIDFCVKQSKRAKIKIYRE